MDLSKEYYILLFGVHGWIGNKVYKLLNDKNINVHIAESRADDYNGVENEINKLKNITHIMSFIGRTHGTYKGQKITTIDYLEKPSKLKENIQDNLYGPLCLGLLAQKYDIHFTYLGTGCIFNQDTENNPNGYTEESEPDFFGSSYSIVKGFTDKMMKLFKTNILNVRIRMPITDEVNERNFITKITNYKKICSIPNSMTVLNDLLPVMIDMSLKYNIGTINLTNPGLISHNEILEMYRDIVDKDFKWENFTIEEQNKILLSKRSNNLLDTTKLENLYPDILNIKDSIRKILLSMKDNIKSLEQNK
jgi:nucleoside-diphosphate-sugar epimerase